MSRTVRVDQGGTGDEAWLGGKRRRRLEWEDGIVGGRCGKGGRDILGMRLFMERREVLGM